MLRGRPWPRTPSGVNTFTTPDSCDALESGTNYSVIMERSVMEGLHWNTNTMVWGSENFEYQIELTGIKAEPDSDGGFLVSNLDTSAPVGGGSYLPTPNPR